MLANLNPDKALIFRITHRANVCWMLEKGLHCPRANVLDPNFVAIGNAELIDKRSRRPVPIEPGGTLHDYVPFYFTPYSPMLLNIRSGYGGVTKRPNSDIVILVSSLASLREARVPFVFTDRHAYLQTAQFSSSLDDLNRIDWSLLRSRDFSRDQNNPGKMERYMAEALAFKHVPAATLLGIGCFDQQTEQQIRADAQQLGVAVSVVARPTWYFT